MSEWRKVRVRDIFNVNADPEEWVIVAQDMPDGEEYIGKLTEAQADAILRDHDLLSIAYQISDRCKRKLAAAEAERDQWKALAEEAWSWTAVMEDYTATLGWLARFDALKAEAEGK